ncbi:MAG: ribosome-associated translation inhibitor RaiA [Lachnospiraceae bacterium]|nr:ribosome-associated translation inhibitor RaiA [Lachnospiraceae bacterium]
MRYTISGKNIDITEGLKGAVESKLGKLERYFSPDTEVQVTLSVEKGRQNIEVTIPIKGSIIRAEQDSNDMYVSIDLVEEIIERQIKKYKTKIIDKKQSAVAFSDTFIQEEAEPEEAINIVKTKRFAMKPMDPEEACLQMELLGHNFFMFLNAETEQINVVYKRKANSYGLIEPEY